MRSHQTKKLLHSEGNYQKKKKKKKRKERKKERKKEKRKGHLLIGKDIYKWHMSLEVTMQNI